MTCVYWDLEKGFRWGKKRLYDAQWQRKGRGLHGGY